MPPATQEYLKQNKARGGGIFRSVAGITDADLEMYGGWSLEQQQRFLHTKTLNQANAVRRQIERESTSRITDLTDEVNDVIDIRKNRNNKNKNKNRKLKQREAKASGATRDSHSDADTLSDSFVAYLGKAVPSVVVAPIFGVRSEAKASGDEDSDLDGTDEQPGASMLPLASIRRSGQRGNPSRAVAQRSSFFGPAHPDDTPDLVAYEEAKRKGKMVVDGE